MNDMITQNKDFQNLLQLNEDAVELLENKLAIINRFLPLDTKKSIISLTSYLSSKRIPVDNELRATILLHIQSPELRGIATNRLNRVERNLKKPHALKVNRKKRRRVSHSNATRTMRVFGKNKVEHRRVNSSGKSKSSKNCPITTSQSVYVIYTPMGNKR